jgi:hypothetical protein
MQRTHEQQLAPSRDNHALETADAVARAAHLWIRSLCLSDRFKASERHSIAGGLVAGLCERLELDPRVRELVAYVYALLDDEGTQALSISRMMLDQPVPRSQRKAYEKGRLEAAGIVEMLAYHGNT